jgi:hypothetical protein
MSPLHLFLAELTALDLIYILYILMEAQISFLMLLWVQEVWQPCLYLRGTWDAQVAYFHKYLIYYYVSV